VERNRVVLRREGALSSCGKMRDERRERGRGTLPSALSGSGKETSTPVEKRHVDFHGGEQGGKGGKKGEEKNRTVQCLL